ncbi:hypothetical protein MTO96_037302, partial [Rhipicephalus appendiculatus]
GSSLKDLWQRSTVVSRAAQLTRDVPLLIVGDFNAPNHIWIYPYDTPMEEDILREAVNRDLMLVTDPSIRTKRLMSASRDTTPDPTFVRSPAEVKWANLKEVSVPKAQVQ